MRVIPVAAVCAALLAVSACGGTPQAGIRSHARAPNAASPSPTVITPAPVTPSVAPPSAAPTPAPAPTSTTLIPQHNQTLTLSGAVTGTVASAEIKECGSGSGGWALELSSMTISDGTASLTLLVRSYNGAGSYRPGGALNAIENQQLLTFPVTGGSVDIGAGGTSGRMNLTLTSAANQRVQIEGSWACV